MKLVVRADANTQIGTGHIMRCIALAQAWKKQCGQVTFISACKSESLMDRIMDEGFQLVPIGEPYPDPTDLETTLLTINNSSSNNSWFVLDGYHFDTHYQQSIKDNGKRLLIIDDTAHLNHYVADIILNQNIIAEEISYPCEPETKLLLGTDYVLLRDEFLSYQNWKRAIPKVAKKIIVTMGGSDLANVTLKVLYALDQVNMNGLEIKVVIGIHYTHLDTLNKIIVDSKHKIELLQNVSNMPDLMAWADLAISGGGSTCWELAFMGLPSLVFVIAENQRANVEMLSEYGFITNLGHKDSLNEQELLLILQEIMKNYEQRMRMATLSQKLVDGRGVDLVLRKIIDRTL